MFTFVYYYYKIIFENWFKNEWNAFIVSLANDETLKKNVNYADDESIM